MFPDSKAPYAPQLLLLFLFGTIMRNVNEQIKLMLVQPFRTQECDLYPSI
eukprot:gene9585-6740_t